MASNIDVSAARLMVEENIESQLLSVESARLLVEYDVEQIIGVSVARLMVEYTNLNSFSATITFDPITLIATLTNTTPVTPGSETKKKNVQTRWLGMQM